MDFVKSIEIAELALKHRSNKSQKQRLIIVLYSPVLEDPAILQTLAKKARKNGVAVDVVNVGVRENMDKLQAFIDTVNNADNSHFLHVDVGVPSVADVVVSSPINQIAAPVAGGASSSAGVAAVDPNMDPELADAIRQSLEEQKNMLQARGGEAKTEEKKEPAPAPGSAAPVAAPAAVPSQPVAAAPGASADDPLAGLSEEEIMQRAIMLSLEGKAEEPRAPEKPSRTCPKCPPRRRCAFSAALIPRELRESKRRTSRRQRRTPWKT